MKVYYFEVVGVVGLSVQAESEEQANNLAIEKAKAIDFKYWNLEADLLSDQSDLDNHPILFSSLSAEAQEEALRQFVDDGLQIECPIDKVPISVTKADLECTTIKDLVIEAIEAFGFDGDGNLA